MKVETITVEYNKCGECPYAYPNEKGLKCDKTERSIPDVWEDIPDWCPLETKEVNND